MGIKIYDQTQVVQRPADNRGNMLSPGMVGNGLGELAQGVSQVAKQVSDEAERLSNIRIQDASNKLSTLYTAHGENAQKTLVGEAAAVSKNPNDNNLPDMDTNPIDKVREDAKREAEKLLATAGTPRQREAIQALINQHDAQFGVALLKHQSKEITRYEDSVMGNTAERMVNEAMSNPSDPKFFAEKLDDAMRALGQISTNRGLDLSQVIADKKSKIALKTVSNMVDAQQVVGGPDGANKHLFDLMTNPSDKADAIKMTAQADVDNQALRVAQQTYYKDMTHTSATSIADSIAGDNAKLHAAIERELSARINRGKADDAVAGQEWLGKVQDEAYKTKDFTGLLNKTRANVDLSDAAKGHSITWLETLKKSLHDSPDVKESQRLAAYRFIWSDRFKNLNKQQVLDEAAKYGAHNIDLIMSNHAAATADGGGHKVPESVIDAASQSIFGRKKTQLKGDEIIWMDNAIIRLQTEHKNKFNGSGQHKDKAWDDTEWLKRLKREVNPQDRFGFDKPLVGAKPDEIKDMWDRVPQDEKDLASERLDLRAPGIDHDAEELMRQVIQDRELQVENPEHYSKLHNAVKKKRADAEAAAKAEAARKAAVKSFDTKRDMQKDPPTTLELLGIYNR